MKTKELLDLYTLDRIRTGETVLRGEKLPDGRYIRAVHVLIFNSDKRLLIQKRSMDKDRWPGLWDISVSGDVLSGETVREAAVRETREELGIYIDLSLQRPLITTSYETWIDDFFTIKQDIRIEELHPFKEEIDEIRWATLEEIESMIKDGSFFPADVDLLRYLFNNC